MNRENGRGFHFGLEAEYLLVDAETFRPLCHRDLSFRELNGALEGIDVADVPALVLVAMVLAVLTPCTTRA